MKNPIIRQFQHYKVNTITTGMLWWKKTRTINTFKKEWSEVREFNDAFNAQLLTLFQTDPPKVGDRIYVEATFRIVKVFYNMNHDRYEIWWVYEPLFDSNDVTEEG